MKTTQRFIRLSACIAFIILQLQLHAQSWSINGNANIAAGTNYLGTSDPNDLVFRSNAIERGRLSGTGEWRFGTAANNARFDAQGRLSFTGTGAYRVGGNRYAFQYSGDPDYGLFFNSTATQYEFRNGTAAPVFYINANTGAIRVGNAYTLPAIDGTPNQVLKTNGAGVLTWSNDNSGSGGWGLTGNSGTAAGTNFIGTTDNAAFAIRTNNLERLRITSDGRAGIGTTAPSAKLHVNSADGEDALRVQIDGITALLVNDNGGLSVGTLTAAPANGMYVSGNVGIGNSSPVNKLDVSGSVGITGNLDANGSIGFGTIEELSDGGSNTIAANSDIVPLSTASSNTLGSSTNRWASVWAVDGTINTSDEKDKQNIRDLSYGLKEVMKLRSVKFNWKSALTAEDKLGLIAQELQKVLPEVVRDYEYKTDEVSGKTTKVPSARLGVMYADIIPVLIRGMQEQQQMIEEQNKKMEVLTKLVNQLTQNSPVSSASASGIQTAQTAATLEQNAPNPFNNSTTIRYSIPTKINKAQIMITNSAGATVKTFTLTNKGSGTVTIHANELAAGSYHYTLMTDGKMADSKQMILVK